MRCEHPLKIRNPYTLQNITVGCRKCDACRIAAANEKALLLQNELKKSSAALFITLTYDNEHLPVVFYGSNCVCRMSNNFQPEETYSEEFLFTPFEPYKYPYSDCTGVLYYRDFQLFLKRLRIRLYRYGKIRIKFFVVGEYGTVRKRPHWHAILFFKSYSDLRGIEESICQSWKMCSEAVTRNGIEVADIGLCSYLASYVNCNDNSYELAKHRFFKQKTHRSACLDYGCSTQDVETVRQSIISGLYQSFDERNLRPFELVDTSQKDCISTRPVSKRVFYTYFRKPFGYGRISSKCFRIRARIIYKFKHSSFQIDLNQMDENFYRGYRAYLLLMGYSDSVQGFEYYLDIYLRAMAAYNSLVLKYWMMEFENRSPEDYFLDCYNTESRSIGSKTFWLDNIRQFGITRFDVMSSVTRHEIHDYRHKYLKKLLPKHQNSMFYKFV